MFNTAGAISKQRLISHCLNLTSLPLLKDCSIPLKEAEINQEKKRDINNKRLHTS